MTRSGDVPVDPEAPARGGRRTKIIATLGPACASVETIAALIDAGADCLRLNCSHGTLQARRELGRCVRTAIKLEQRNKRDHGASFDQLIRSARTQQHAGAPGAVEPVVLEVV